MYEFVLNTIEYFFLTAVYDFCLSNICVMTLKYVVRVRAHTIQFCVSLS
jgi:hypothetical protein